MDFLSVSKLNSSIDWLIDWLIIAKTYNEQYFSWAYLWEPSPVYSKHIDWNEECEIGKYMYMFRETSERSDSDNFNQRDFDERTNLK